MEFNINSELKPLYANLLRIGIDKYLISDQFHYLCIEINIDQLWDECEKCVHNRTGVAVLDPGYTGYAEETLGLFLTELFKIDKKRFLDILGKILRDFANWSHGKLDFSGVKNALLELGYSQKEIDSIFREIETQNVNNFQKIQSLETEETYIDRTLCFVLMPFAQEFDSVYEKIIKRVVEKFGLKCRRADEIFGTKPIIEDIRECIKKANILIADLTGRNPNVFYELGFAHALNKDVILITQNIDDVPFDVRHYRCIVYEDSISGAEELREKLKNTLKQVLSEKKKNYTHLDNF